MFVLPYPDIDPAIFTVELFGMTLSLRWYALAYIAGLVLGWRYVVRLVRRPALWPGGKAPMNPDQPEDLLTWMVLGVVIGGRLGFVLFYQPGRFIADPAGILAVWEGGMSFHGGFLGVVAGVILFCRARGLPLASVSDAVACAAPVGLLLGRVANFVNGELWGRASDLPWAMVFPGGGPEPRHPSQLYEALLEGALLFTVMWWLATRKGWLRAPWAMTGVFLLGYGLGRSVVELARQPDAFFAAPGNPLGHALQFGGGAGLTMGQLLSLPMAALGALVIARARRGAASGA